MTAPRIARALLALSARRQDRRYIVAEADEAFETFVCERGEAAARRWYWRQAWSSLAPGVWGQLAAPAGRPPAGLFRRALTQSVRSVRRQPAFATSVVLTLTFGVTAATVVFSLVEAVILRPLPYRAPNELIALSFIEPARGVGERDISGPDFFDIGDMNRTLAELAAYEVAPAALAGRESGAIKIDVARLSPELFTMLDVSADAGRLFLPEESGPGGPNHIVLSTSLALRHFGSTLGALDQTLSLDGDSYLVIGVLSRRPPLPGLDVDAWLPLPYGRTSLNRRAGVLAAVARMAPGVTLEQTRADLARIAAGLAERYPESNTGREFAAIRLSDQLTADLRPLLAALTFAMVLVLGVAVVNASGLFVVRYLRRESELVIRTTLGASRTELVSQLMAEGLIVGGLVAAASVAVGGAIVTFAGRIVPGIPAQLASIDPGATAWAAGAGAGLVAAMLATAIAMWSVRSGSLVLRGAAKRKAQRARQGLLAGQLAATTVLLVSVALLGRSLSRLTSVDPGFEPAQLVSAAVDLPGATYPTDMSIYPAWPQIQGFYDRLLADVNTLPNIDGAALAWHHPLRRGWLTRFAPEGQEDVPVGERDMVNIRAVSPGYFRVVGATLGTGRDVSDADVVATEPVALINRTLEERYFPAGDALGSRVLFFGKWWRVIGIVDDFKSHGLAAPTRPAVFPALRQMPSEMFHVVVRGSGSPAELLEGVRDAVWRIDPEIAPYNLEPLATVLASETADRRFVAWLFRSFGAIALALAAVGLFGSMAEMIEARRRELGLRSALGATQPMLFRSMLTANLTTTAAGIVVGLIVATGVTRLLTAWLFGVSATSPLAYGWAAVVLFAAAAVATAIPAMRLLRYDARDLLRES